MIKVLIAEDQDEVRELMSDGVSAAGYEVVTAKNGKDALEKIEKEAPDVILLDLMMPEMNGFEVLEKLRKELTHNKWQPVIIVSALNELKDMQKSFSLEADHYITKPYEMRDVIKGIEMMASLIPQRKAKFEIDGDEYL